MRKAKPKAEPNLTARYLARLTRAARNGEIIGFAAVAIMKGPPHAQETWYAPPDDARRLVGEVHMLNQKVAWHVGGPRVEHNNPPLIAKRKKVVFNFLQTDTITNAANARGNSSEPANQIDLSGEAQARGWSCPVEEEARRRKRPVEARNGQLR